MHLRPWQGGLHFGIVSGAVLATVALCIGLHDLSHLGQYAPPHPHAVSLPFGLLVILTWIYGWTVMPMVVPASLLSAWLVVGSMVFDPTNLAILGFKLVAVPLVFDLLRWSGLDARGVGPAANWKMLVAIGLLGSMLGNVPRPMLGPCCTTMDSGARLIAYWEMVVGDMAGLILVLLAVMLVFRALRHG